MCASVLSLWLFITRRHESDWTITVSHILWQITANTGTTTSVQCFHNENSFHTVTLKSCVYVDRSCLFVSQLDVCAALVVFWGKDVSPHCPHYICLPDLCSGTSICHCRLWRLNKMATPQHIVRSSSFIRSKRDSDPLTTAASIKIVKYMWLFKNKMKVISVWNITVLLLILLSYIQSGNKRTHQSKTG